MEPAVEIPDDVKQRLKTSYDIISPTYNEWTERDMSIRKKYLDKLLPHLAENPSTKRKVLELGCGAGTITKTIASIKHVEIIANDMSTTQIETAKGNLAEFNDTANPDRITFIESDMMALSFQDNSLDAVIAFYSVIHLSTKEQEILLSRIASWLKPDGRILINFGAEVSTGNIHETWLHEAGWMYWSSLGVEKTIEAIKKVDLEIELQEVSKDVVDADFLWVIAKKSA